MAFFEGTLAPIATRLPSPFFFFGLKIRRMKHRTLARTPGKEASATLVVNWRSCLANKGWTTLTVVMMTKKKRKMLTWTTMKSECLQCWLRRRKMPITKRLLPQSPLQVQQETENLRQLPPTNAASGRPLLWRMRKSPVATRMLKQMGTRGRKHLRQRRIPLKVGLPKGHLLLLLHLLSLLLGGGGGEFQRRKPRLCYDRLALSRAKTLLPSSRID